MVSYRLYGVGVDCNRELPGLVCNAAGPNSPALQLTIVEPKPIETANGAWFQRTFCRDDAIELCWQKLFHFHIPADGRHITATPHPGVTQESLAVYLLGQVMAVALARQGWEVLHGAAVAKHGQAVLILGDSGYGKSTLTAALWQAGWELVSDDLLLPWTPAHGPPCVSPGPARIKLERDSVGAVGHRLPPPLSLMHPLTDKAVFPLPAPTQPSYPIASVVCLAAPKSLAAAAPHLAPLSGAAAFRAIVTNNFNILEWAPARGPQILAQSTALANQRPIWELRRARTWDTLPATVDLFDELVARHDKVAAIPAPEGRLPAFASPKDRRTHHPS